MPKQHKEEFPPLLAAGFHPITLGGLRKMCVDAYPSSQRRAEIMSGVESIHTRLVGMSITGEMWVDGSFLTRKEEPDDVDVAFFVPSVFFDHGSKQQIAFLDWLSNESEAEMDRKRELFSCHAFLHAEYPLTSPMAMFTGAAKNQLQDEFGHSVVTREPKGIAVVQLWIAPTEKKGA